MKFVTFLVTMSFLQMASAVLAEEAQDSSKSTSQSEEHYRACIKDAQELQKRYSACTTKDCRDGVTKDFEAWSGKCFKQ